MEQVLGSSSQDCQQPPIPGGHGLTTSEREQTDLSARIKGWGTDLDRQTRPGEPYDKNPMLGVESLNPAIPQQIPKFKIHKSTEHGQLTPVFGTSCPPRRLSGRIRDFGYQFSEGRLAHWLSLMFADRVDVVEGIIDDLAQGHIPNIPKEMGLATEWRYNRKEVIKKTVIGVGCMALMVLWRVRSKRANG